MVRKVNGIITCLQIASSASNGRTRSLIMKLIICLVWALFLAAVAALFGIRHSSSVRAEATDPMQPIRPVVVELFTSEGCSSCPPADALLAKLDQEHSVGGAEVITLEEHVDYWDRLGWRDPYSSSRWTLRQQDYALVFHRDGVYTPQMVVDGTDEFIGSRERQARQAIHNAAERPKAEIHLEPVSVASGRYQLKIDVQLPPELHKAKGARVWLAVTESGLHTMVSGGENAGRDLHHAAVVRSLQNVGALDPRATPAFRGEPEVKLDESWKRENIRFVVFVQDKNSLRVLGAASVHPS